MIRANIYSTETLGEEQRLAIEEGLDLVAGYIGETVATRALRVRVPENPDGTVNPYRIGFGQFDKMVELHLMAVPFSRNTGTTNGLAYRGKGVGIVDLKSRPGVLRSVTAHEGAHAFRFLRDGAPQADGDDAHHCASGDCILHWQNRTRLETEEVKIPREKGVYGMLQHLMNGSKTDLIFSHEPVQTDFCNPCRTDLAGYGPRHIADLRMERLAEGRVGGAAEIVRER